MLWFYSVCYFGLLLVFADGNCGFPGRPKYGEVQIEFNEPEPVAFYTCPSRKMEGHDRRFCIDGIWNGTIPRCGSKLESAFHSAAISNLTDGNRSSCEFAQEFLNSSNWSIQVAENPSSQYKKIECSLEPTSSIAGMFAFVCKIMKNCYSINLTVNGSRNYQICEVEVYTFPDECDKPEEPINGRVNWNATTATYQCDPGFRLTNASLIRRCTRGRWSGHPPFCFIQSESGFQGSNGFTRENFANFALTAVIICLLLFIFFKHRGRNTPLVETPDCTNSETGIAAPVYENIIPIPVNTDPTYAELEFGNGRVQNPVIFTCSETDHISSIVLSHSESTYAVIGHPVPQTRT